MKVITENPIPADTMRKLFDVVGTIAELNLIGRSGSMEINICGITVRFSHK